MPFPFLPAGAIVAVSVLIGALTAFGLILRATDRAATRAVAGLRGSVLPSLVSGIRGWSVPSGPTPPETTGSPDASLDPARTTQPPQGGIEIIDLEG
jgi:hypothetical protein